MNNQLFKPLVVGENDFTHCPYTLEKNIYKGTSLPQPYNADGTPADHICLPQLSMSNPPEGFGKSICVNSKPVHISYNTTEQKQCFHDNLCNHSIEKCYNP